MFAHLLHGLFVSVTPPPMPWWDAVWSSDILVVSGFGVSWLLYWRQKVGSVRSQRQSTLNHLKGVKKAMESWPKSFFTTNYEGEAAETRSEADYNEIMRGGYGQVFQVSTEPVASLLQPPGGSWPIASETVEAASVALQQMRVFNQLVQQQSDFNSRHAAELRDGNLDEYRHQAIAMAGRRISRSIHASGIGNAEWFKRLLEALDENIQALEDSLR